MCKVSVKMKRMPQRCCHPYLVHEEDMNDNNNDNDRKKYIA